MYIGGYKDIVQLFLQCFKSFKVKCWAVKGNSETSSIVFLIMILDWKIIIIAKRATGKKQFGNSMRPANIYQGCAWLL